jgi:hypothetical protein
MAKKKQEGTNLVKNPFKTGMLSSIFNAGIISAFIENALYTKRLLDSRIMDLYNYFTPLDTILQAIIAVLTGKILDRKSATRQVELTQKGMQPHVHGIFFETEKAYAKTTSEYARLTMGGTESFYGGSRFSITTRVTAYIAATGTDVTLNAARTIAVDLLAHLSGDIADQTSEKVNVNTDKVSVKTAVENSTTGVWYVYLGLMMIYILTPLMAIAFIPMTFIYKAARQQIKTLMVPKASIRKILSHLFKVGETFTAKNNGTVDLLIGLALTATDPVLVWYLLPAGQTVTDIAYSLLGNPTYKFVMTKNANLTTAGDLTFTVNGI